MNNTDNNYETVKNSLLGIGIDTVADYAELTLDSFLDDNVIKDIPIVGTFIKMGKIGITIKNLQFAKNYCTFIKEIRNDEKTVEELEKHINDLNDNPKQMNKEIETLLINLEQYKEVEKVKYMTNIYRAFLSSKIYGISWDQAVIFFEILDRLLPCDIEDLKKMATQGAKAKDFNDHSGLLRLSALGILQYFDGKEEQYGHNKIGLAKLTSQGKIFYRVITTARKC